MLLLGKKKKKTKPLLFIFPHLYPCQYAFWGAELQYQGLTWVGWWMQAHCIIFGKVWWQQRCLHMISEILLYLSNLSIMYLLVSLTLYMNGDSENASLYKFFPWWFIFGL